MTPRGPLQNFALVDTRPCGGKLYRSAQPTAEGLATAAALGITKVYKLNPGVDPIAAAQAGVIVHDAWPMSTTSPELDELVGLLGFVYGDLEGGLSVLVHCRRGIDRTGLIIGAYRAHANKWPFDAIMAERALFGIDLASELMDHRIVELLRHLSLGNDTGPTGPEGG
jgi:hypothetical protein